jgi:hypothetical protein
MRMLFHLLIYFRSASSFPKNVDFEIWNVICQIRMIWEKRARGEIEDRERRHLVLEELEACFSIAL